MPTISHLKKPKRVSADPSKGHTLHVAGTLSDKENGKQKFVSEIRVLLFHKGLMSK